MKTIEQAARESAEKAFGVLDDDMSDIDGEFYYQHTEAFKAGVEFAQRWIPVEEESPAEYEWVIAKSNHGDHYIASYSFYTYHVNMPFEVKITHWRPIEYK